MSDTTLYAPPDVEWANALWGANCGPCAMAALLGRTLLSVREFFPGFPDRAYVTPTTMKAALDLAGARWKLTFRDVGGNAFLPLHGLAFLQVDGPWCKPGVPATVAYRSTHWAAVVCLGEKGSAVYDVNAGRWLPRREWERAVMPLIIAAHPRATGWWCRAGIEVAIG